VIRENRFRPVRTEGVRSLLVIEDASAPPGRSAAVAVAGLTWRSLGRADIPALTRLFAAAEEVDRTGEHMDEQDVEEEFQAAGFDPQRQSFGAVGPDGELVCGGLVHLPRTVRDVDRVGLSGTVHPVYRGEGIGRQLLTWQEARGEARHRARHPAVPGQLMLCPYAHVTDHVRLAERSGYTAVRWFNEMLRDLNEPVPEPPPVPAGLRLVPFDPSLDDAVRRAHNEAFVQHWGSSERDQVGWAEWFTRARAFEPAVSFLVLDGDQVAAYLLSYHWPADAAATGLRDAWIGQIGTRPPWRGRGLGSAMIGRALVAYRDAGYHRAALGVDTENVTGALRLYERHGFTVEVRRVSYVKPLG
jgi:mycothiol synthase